MIASQKMVQSLLFLSLAAGLVSCVGSSNTTTVDGISQALGQKPYIEAYVQYSGPNEKWAGPQTLSLYVSAKESGTATVTFSPDFFKDPSVSGTARTVASDQGFPAEMARDRINLLAVAISAENAAGTFKGCLSPIRVRLVRTDGALLEKQGCRGFGFAKGVSEFTSDFITAHTYGMRNPRGPASETKKAEAVVSENAHETNLHETAEKPAHTAHH